MMGATITTKLSHIDYPVFRYTLAFS